MSLNILNSLSFDDKKFYEMLGQKGQAFLKKVLLKNERPSIEDAGHIIAILRGCSPHIQDIALDVFSKVTEKKEIELKNSFPSLEKFCGLQIIDRFFTGLFLRGFDIEELFFERLAIFEQYTQKKNMHVELLIRDVNEAHSGKRMLPFVDYKTFYNALLGDIAKIADEDPELLKNAKQILERIDLLKMMEDQEKIVFACFLVRTVIKRGMDAHFQEFFLKIMQKIELLAVGTLFHFLESLKKHMEQKNVSYEKLQQVIGLYQENSSDRMQTSAHHQEGHLDSILEHFPLMKEEIKRSFIMVQASLREKRKQCFSSLVERMKKIRTVQEKAPFLEEMIAIAIIGIEKTKQMTPRITQIVAILAFLKSTQSSLGQIKTGEGKSLIIAILGLIMAMQHGSVHIVSSAGPLSIRDRKAFNDFFDLFNITTGHICDDQTNKNVFQKEVLYGTSSDFCFGIMREIYYGEKHFREPIRTLLDGKRFPCVIVDEVDNFLIDTVLNGARLSHPAHESNDWVYIPIFQYIQELNSDKKNSQEVIDNLREYMKRNTLPEKVDALSDKKLKKWIDRAKMALFEMHENKDYVITKEKSQNKVLIVDKDTGQFSMNCRWSKGLHEYIEVKHNISTQKESHTPISMSHAVFYDQYQRVFGLTGTLGSKNQREELQMIYNIPSFDVPTYHSSQRTDNGIKIFSTKETYFEAILQSISNAVSEKRPVLVLCETIVDSIEMIEYLKDKKIMLQILNGVQSEDEGSIVAAAGNPSTVTIATNKAARGTDILLTKESMEFGLHVILTFYPDSLRVEEQAIGRAGRQGQPGSSELIVFHSNTSLEDLFLKRNLQELLTKTMRVRRASSERKMAHFVDVFFITLNSFEAYIRKESTQKYVFDRFREYFQKPETIVLSQSMKEFFSNEDASFLWPVLFFQIAQSVKDTIITLWIKKFYRRAESMAVSEEKSENIEALYNEVKKDWEKLLSMNNEDIFQLFLNQNIDRAF